MLLSECTFTIAGTTKSIEPDTLTANLPANGRGTLTCRIVSADGSYIPAMDAAVELVAGAGEPYASDGQVLFGGSIIDIDVAGVSGEPFAPITSTITVAQHAQIPDRKWINEVFAAGTLKTVLTTLVNGSHLGPYGVTLDPAQADGASLPALLFTGYGRELLDQLATLTGWTWEINQLKQLRMYAPGDLAAPFDLVEANDGVQNAEGDIRVRTSRRSDAPYANAIIVVAGADASIIAHASDATEISAHTEWDLAVVAPTVTTQADADQLALALLAAHLPLQRIVEYVTPVAGLAPGRTQAITASARSLGGTFLITEVGLATDGDRLIFPIRATEGVYHGAWWDTYRAWSAGGGTQQVVGMGGGGSAVSRKVYLLSSGLETWEPAAGVWRPASWIKVTIDTVERGTLAGRVWVQLKAASGTVTARLYNSDGATLGTSAASAATSYGTPTSFAVTLTPGTKTYWLEIQSSVGGVAIGAISHLE